VSQCGEFFSIPGLIAYLKRAFWEEKHEIYKQDNLLSWMDITHLVVVF
jgi:hypothetical protein